MAAAAGSGGGVTPPDTEAARDGEILEKEVVNA
jgi:hypothetical protein